MAARIPGLRHRLRPVLCAGPEPAHRVGQRLATAGSPPDGAQPAREPRCGGLRPPDPVCGRVGLRHPTADRGGVGGGRGGGGGGPPAPGRQQPRREEVAGVPPASGSGARPAPLLGAAAGADRPVGPGDRAQPAGRAPRRATTVDRRLDRSVARDRRPGRPAGPEQRPLRRRPAPQRVRAGGRRRPRLRRCRGGRTTTRPRPVDLLARAGCRAVGCCAQPLPRRQLAVAPDVHRRAHRGGGAQLGRPAPTLGRAASRSPDVRAGGHPGVHPDR